MLCSCGVPVLVLTTHIKLENSCMCQKKSCFHQQLHYVQQEVHGKFNFSVISLRLWPQDTRNEQCQKLREIGVKDETDSFSVALSHTLLIWDHVEATSPSKQQANTLKTTRTQDKL